MHPADLGAHSIHALMERVDVDPAAVDDVVFGCVDTIGPQAGDIARTCWLVAGYSDEVPGTTVDRQCGSSQQAVHFAAQAVMSGTTDLVVAGGVQNMSAIPISAAMLAGEQYGFENPFAGSPGWEARYGTQEVSQFRSAEMIAEKWDISRDDMEAFAVESHDRALRARAEGRFDREIVPLAGVDHDEGPREPDLDKIRSLRTLVEGGRLTAAVSSQISDASAALLIASEAAVKDARTEAPRPHPSPLGARRRPGVDAHRADPGDRVRAEEGRHEPRRHRPRRDQRGVRVGRARVAEGNGRRPRARSTSTAARSRSATRSAQPAPA